MARRRFFIDTLRNGLAELHGEDARHLTRVLRVEPGQRYEISDNRAAYLAEIAEARGERVLFRVLEPIPAPDAAASITLLASIIKFDRFEWIVEKATELGVERIVPVAATRTEKGLFDASAKRTERWLRIAREASQQSRRIRMPEIPPAVRFERASSWVRNLRVHVDEQGGYTGFTAGLDPQGLLQVRLDDGTTRTVRHGGVRRALPLSLAP